jgi:hypothetical protein
MAAFLGLALASPFAQSPAPAPEKPWYRAVTFDVLAEASYTYSFNSPDSGLNQYRAFDFVVQGDLRCDWSNEDVFQKRALYVRSQPTASVQLIYVF